VDKQQVAALRDAYRKKHLLALAPDNRHGGTPKGEWTELVGESYDRTIHGFQVDSTPAQDQRFIDTFNDGRNVGHFNILFHKPLMNGVKALEEHRFRPMYAQANMGHPSRTMERR
jgi:hypothetical protein